MIRRLVGCPVLFVAVTLMLSGCCPTPNTVAVYVAFGDSITKGKDSPTYPEELADRLGLSHNQIANQGESGESANDGLARIKQFFVTCDTFPNAHTLLYWQGAAGLIDWIQDTDPLLLWDPFSPGYPFQAALNERLGNIKNNIKSAIGMAQGAVSAVYVATYFDVLPNVSPCDAFAIPFLPPAAAEKANHYVALLNEKIAEAASETGTILVDINGELGALNNDPANFIDCNHPSGDGNSLIAQVFYETIIGP